MIEHTIDPSKVDAFEAYADEWMRLVERERGTHHDYFMPSEGASDRALALFTFDSLSKYERYCAKLGVEPEFIAADLLRVDSGCVIRWDRTLMRPHLPSREQVSLAGREAVRKRSTAR